MKLFMILLFFPKWLNRIKSSKGILTKSAAISQFSLILLQIRRDSCKIKSNALSIYRRFICPVAPKSSPCSIFSSTSWLWMQHQQKSTQSESTACLRMSWDQRDVELRCSLDGVTITTSYYLWSPLRALQLQYTAAGRWGRQVDDATGGGGCLRLIQCVWQRHPRRVEEADVYLITSLEGGGIQLKDSKTAKG